MADTAKADGPRGEIRFRFRGSDCLLDRFRPRTTLLDWLRETAGAKGTKEGCAEGDCGACTVVLARVRNGELVHEAVNACILLLGQIDGSELLTVEDLADGSTLHPLQQAMVAHHGSQCGFCTPGIVMSLFALHHSGKAATRSDVCDSLAGNLCRCTGYRPIIEAALEICRGPANDRFARIGDERVKALKAINDDTDLLIGDEQAFFAAPAGEESLGALLKRHPDAVLVSGATDVGLWITKKLRDIKKIIWLGRVKGFEAVIDGPDELTLRAGVTLERARSHLASLHPDLGELMRRFGSTQVRVSGTIGGNIANGSPIGDMAPALIALGARVELKNADRARTLPLEDFFLGYGKQDRAVDEYVSALHVPRPTAGTFYRALKISKRFDEDISAVMAAFNLTVVGRRVVAARVAFGGMAATPKRAATTETALTGCDLDTPSSWSAAIEALKTDFKPLDDHRASAAYRRRVAAGLLEKALTEIAGTAIPTRVGDYRVDV